MSDELETIIEDSITDAEIPETQVEEPVAATPATPEPAPAEPAVPEPEPKVEDDFDKKYGLAPQAQSGRENRIPYSRVRKISDKAASDAVAAKVKEYETTHVPTAKYQELETKVKEYEPRIKDYESRLGQVAQFEQIMMNDVPRFLTMLAGLPQYNAILAPLFGQQPQQQAQRQVPNDMPQPDQQLPDGSKFYSMEGLKALREWDRKQTAADVMKQVESRYAPLERDYQTYQQAQQAYRDALPQVQRQIEDARKWPLFNESETEIVKVLADNPSFNLERAYQAVVLPKLQTTRDQLRTEILKEVKQAPKATSVPATPVKAAPQQKAAHSLEDVIEQSLREAGLR